jgi:hypothetical protein
MKCLKCGGRGYTFKHENCYHGAEESYIRGCYDQKVCSKCRGSGATGWKLVADILLEIKLESNDLVSRKLAEKALKELSDSKGC